METTEKTKITISTKINAPIDNVWKCWNTPDDIVKWCTATEEWHTTKSENDLRVGGKFSSRMEAKDGSTGFDFAGVYKSVKPNELIEYEMEDGRKVKVTFKSNGKETEIIETFEAESENPVEMQRGGWQNILDNFKKYTENNK